MTALDRANIRLPYVTDDAVYFPDDVPSLLAFLADMCAGIASGKAECDASRTWAALGMEAVAILHERWLQ